MTRGAKPGERRGGRAKGTPNKFRVDASVAIENVKKFTKHSIEGLAAEHAPAALQALVYVATNGQTEAARVAAANSILDRAFGKARQSVAHENPDGTPLTLQRQDDVALIREIIRMGSDAGLPVTIDGDYEEEDADE